MESILKAETKKLRAFWGTGCHVTRTLNCHLPQVTLCHTVLTYIFTPPLVGVQSIVINPSLYASVCVCVCQSVCCEHISGTAGPIFTNFLVKIPCGYARSYSGGIAIHCVLSVLCMTSCLAIVGRMVMRGRPNL